MRKLDTKDIAGYLPHGLAILFTDAGVVAIEGEQPEHLDFISLDDMELYPWLINGRAKPILRPFRDMYHYIEHNNERILPILECAKMADKHKEWRAETPSGELAPYAPGIDCDYMFKYFQERGFVSLKSCNNNIVRVEIAKNQHELFDYLDELKIDYRGLIAAGLAIDEHGLKVNPYK